jgi:hypothetical protein
MCGVHECSNAREKARELNHDDDDALESSISAEITHTGCVRNHTHTLCTDALAKITGHRQIDIHTATHLARGRPNRTTGGTKELDEESLRRLLRRDELWFDRWLDGTTASLTPRGETRTSTSLPTS